MSDVCSPKRIASRNAIGSDDNEPPRKRRQRRSNEENENYDDDNLFNTERSIRNLQSESQALHDFTGLSLSEDMESLYGAGQVTGIELENFMCHKNLHVKFDTDKYNCFYIVGPNGSGKSAIFAGLNIGLGGKGRSNDRGSSLMAYIKEGESYAKIRVFLRNTGDNKHPDYAERIIIERIIRGSGGSYSLKSAKTEHGISTLISTNKKDLDALLKRFSIELENPLCWLSQDRSRQFLQAMKPEKLYEIFMITSALKKTEEMHLETDDHYKELKTILDDNKNKQQQLLKEYKEMEAKATAGKKVEKCEKQISQSKWLMCWVPIVKIRKRIVEVEKSIESVKAKKQENETRVSKRDEEVADLRNRIKELTEKQENLNKEHRAAMDVVRKHNTDDSNNFVEFKAAQTREKQIMKQIEIYDADMADSRATLESILGSADRDLVGEKAELQRSIIEEEQAFKSGNDQKEMLEVKKKRIDEERKERYREIHEVQNKIYSCENGFKEIRKRIEQSKIVAQNQLNRFGPDTPKILEILKQNASKFSRLPIGPIGLHIQVSNAKWIKVVDHNLRNLVSGYIVDNAKDRILFEDLLESQQIRIPQITVTKFSQHRHDTRNFEPSAEYLTIARVTKIDDATVFNYLVDKQEIERTLLIEDDQEARSLMSRNPPENVKVTITLQLASVHPKKHDRPYRYYAGPGNDYTPKCLGKQVITDENYFKQKIEEIEREKATLKTEYDEKSLSLKNMKTNFDEISNEIRQIDLKNIKNEQRIRELKEKMNALDKIATRETLINNAKNAITEVQAKKAQAEEKLANIRKQMSEYETKMENCRREKDELLVKTKEVKQKCITYESQLTEYRKELRNFDSLTEELRSDIRMQSANLDKLVQKREQHIVEQEKFEAGLEKRHEYEKPDAVSDPPDFVTIPSEEQIKGYITKFEKEKREAQKLLGGDNITEKDLENAKNALEIAKKDVKNIAESSYKAKTAFDARKLLYEKVKNELPARLKQKFSEFMSMRNYKGDLKVDNFNKKIDILVETHQKGASHESEDDDSEPDYEEEQNLTRTNKRKKKVVQDLKGLSGGERSYTTACFVMALWTCVDSPFRCLDEFDVFMDMMNRRVIMEMLADLAKRNRHIQFFFFTPQSISELNHDDVEVFQLTKNRATNVTAT